MSTELPPEPRGRLTLIRRLKHPWALWKCSCGTIKEIRYTNVITNSKKPTKSCGCWVIYLRKNSPCKKANPLQGNKIYKRWSSMMNRCYGKTNKQYGNYGGRGILVCRRWHSFELYAKDTGPTPPGKSLDRINNNKGYSPKNCRWATRVEQSANRRNVRIVEYKGQEKPLYVWCREFNLNAVTVHYRMFKNVNRLSFEDAIKHKDIRVTRPTKTTKAKTK